MKQRGWTALHRQGLKYLLLRIRQSP